MAFLAPALLAGVLLIGIPIALHLRRRRDPVRVEFPALRLLKRNRHRTETQLRLRRWVLLALRCCLLALLAAALARPLLKPPSAAAADGPAGEGVGLALVIDNGPNAAYQSRNQTRLEAAQELAGKLLAGLPGDTPVVLADRAAGGGASMLEPAAAAARVDRLRVGGAAKPLAAAVRDAVTRLAETPAARREVYVFTDLSAGAWDEASQRTVAAVLDKHPGIALRLVDVGVAEPRNAAIDDLRMPSESLAVGEALALSASIHLVGEWREPLAVQLWIDGEKGPVKRDERLVEPKGKGVPVEFTLSGLNDGFTTGFVRVIAGDAAPDDDARYFAVEVRRPRSMLIVAPEERDAVFFRSAIDPSVIDPSVAPRFETGVITLDAWPRQSLAGYDAVVMIDPSPAVESGRGWRRLYDAAIGGAGVGVFLGGEATLDEFNSPDAQALLPGKLEWRSREPTYLRPTSFAHPAIKPLAPYADAILWQTFPVFQRWELGDFREGAAVVARYADGGPAIVEQSVGRGRVLVMTTSVNDRYNPAAANGGYEWNRLPTGDDPWPFVLLARSLADHLTGAADAQLSYIAGETVSAPLPTGVELPGYVLRTPGGEAVRQSVPPGRSELAIPAATEPGPYRIEAGADLDRRFVVNLDPRAGHVERVEFNELQTALGKDRVKLLKSEEELTASIDLGRVGRELYGWVLALVAAALVGEQWVGNRYYRQTKEDQ